MASRLRGGQCDLSSGLLSRLWASLGVTASGTATVRDASGYVSFVIRSEEDGAEGRRGSTGRLPSSSMIIMNKSTVTIAIYFC